MTDDSTLPERQKHQRAIAAQESLRGVIEATIVGAAVARYQEKLVEVKILQHARRSRDKGKIESTQFGVHTI